MKQKIDVPLSEHVAKEASQQINKLDKELNENKDSYIFFLKDVVNDGKDHVKFLRKIIKGMFAFCIILVLAIVGLTIFSIRNSNKQSKEFNQQLMDFINETDFYYEVELKNESSNFNTNNMNLKK